MGSLSKKLFVSLGVITATGLVLTGAVMSTTNASNVNDNKQTQAEVKPKEETKEQPKAQEAEVERTVTETKRESVGFETKTVNDGSIEYGKTVVRTQGSNGEKTYTYSVTYKGNKEVARKLVKEEITRQPVAKVIAVGTKIVWHCVDATSYNKNPYDDNRCTSSTGEVRYVSDSQSRALDPSYVPGTSGHYWYNSK